jgi:hypothetical protein
MLDETGRKGTASYCVDVQGLYSEDHDASAGAKPLMPMPMLKQTETRLTRLFIGSKSMALCLLYETVTGKLSWKGIDRHLGV